MNFKKEINFDNFGIDINGEVLIKQTAVPIQITKVKDSKEIKFSMKTTKIAASDVVALFSKKQLDADKDAPPQAGLFTKAELNNPVITGTRNKDESFEMVAKGEVTGIKGIYITLFEIKTSFIV